MCVYMNFFGKKSSHVKIFDWISRKNKKEERRKKKKKDRMRGREREREREKQIDRDIKDIR